MYLVLWKVLEQADESCCFLQKLLIEQRIREDAHALVLVIQHVDEGMKIHF